MIWFIILSALSLLLLGVNHQLVIRLSQDKVWVSSLLIAISFGAVVAGALRWYNLETGVNWLMVGLVGTLWLIMVPISNRRYAGVPIAFGIAIFFWAVAAAYVAFFTH